MIRSWKANIWDSRHRLKKGGWRYYYCSWICLLTDQHICFKHKRFGFYHEKES